MWTKPETIPTVQEIFDAASSVQGLRDQKMRIAGILHRHLLAAANNRPYSPSSCLVLGPTGGGKTYMLNKMLEASGLPFIDVNATQYSEVGYIGSDLSSSLLGFIKKYEDRPNNYRAKDVVADVQRWGVVILDEFDKWRMVPNPKERQPQRALQSELLKIVEGDWVLAQQNEGSKGWVFQTHHMLFIASGAFEGLQTQMEKRFSADGDKRAEMPNVYQYAEPLDITEYGFMQELVGRFPTIIPLPPLNARDMAVILRNSYWKQWQQEAEDRGVTLEADEYALVAVAAQAIEKKTGARALPNVLDALLWRPFSEAEAGDRIRLTAEQVERRKEGRAELIRGAA